MLMHHYIPINILHTQNHIFTPNNNKENHKICLLPIIGHSKIVKQKNMQKKASGAQT